MPNRNRKHNRSGSSGQLRRPSNSGNSPARTSPRQRGKRTGNTGAGTQASGGTRPRADNNRGGSRARQRPRTGQQASVKRRTRQSEQGRSGMSDKGERRRLALATPGEREHKRRGSRSRAGGPTLKRKTSRRARGTP